MKHFKLKMKCLAMTDSSYIQLVRPQEWTKPINAILTSPPLQQDSNSYNFQVRLMDLH